MSETNPPAQNQPAANPSIPTDDFARQAQEQDPGLVREFADFLLNNKKWWLTPIVLMLLLLGLVALLSSSVAAPFIYPFF